MIIALVAMFAVLFGIPANASSAPAKSVVVIGVPGLQWSDVTLRDTPNLWKLTGENAAAAMSVRTTTNRTCSIDGWLTVSAGQRARLKSGSCALPPEPQPSGTGAVEPGWQAIVADNASTGYAARVGMLGDAVHRAGGCTYAVGAGGVLGAADASGSVDHFARTPWDVPAADWTKCALTIVDIDELSGVYVRAGVDASGEQAPVSPAQRAAAARAVDASVGRVVAALPSGIPLLVAGLADATGTPHLHAAIGTVAFERGYLTANSTRREGLVTLTDLPATVLHILGIPQPSEAVGSAWTSVPSAASAAQKVENLTDQDIAAQAIRLMSGAFFIVLFAGQLLLYGFAAIALRRGRPGPGPVTRSRILATTRVGALAGAAAPVGTYLANLVPWWRSAHPAPALMACVLAAMALVTGLSLAGPWRRTVLGPGLVIAAITAFVLGLDAMTGSDLQMNAFMGYTALVGGRFYGFGNMAFAVFATASILSAAWLAEGLLARGRRNPAVAVVVTIGLVAMAVDGMPGWGSDFGGVVAILLGTAVLTLLIGGWRVSVLRLGLVGLAGSAVVLGMAFFDSLRAEPTHLGKFWDQLAAGDAWGVIMRKFEAMLRSFGYWPFTIVAIGALLFLFLVLARPLTWRAAALEAAYRRTYTLRPALFAGLTVALVGMLMNDSGVVIPALVLTLAVPLVLAACVRALELDAADAGTSRSEEPEPRPTPAA
ncbi:hypothetical protein [Actinocorallia longicatena]